MSQLTIIIIAAWLAGLAGFIGGVIALIAGNENTETKSEINHGIIAFGGGILIAAVAFKILFNNLYRIALICQQELVLIIGEQVCLRKVRKMNPIFQSDL